MNLGFEERGWCFDDLGSEETGKHFGKNSEVMTEILFKIYNSREAIGKIHITTNFDGDGLENIYGNRMRRRLKEMFNLIKFSPDAPDRTK